jgi:hypothetical protein
VHRDADKAVWITAGHYRFRVGGQVTVATEGSFVFVPRNTPHDFSVGPGGGRAIFVFSPSGIEHYFRELMRGGFDDARHLAELRHRHQIEAVTGDRVVARDERQAVVEGGDRT